MDREEDAIRLWIVWPNHSTLGVRAPQGAYLRDLTDILRFSIPKHRQITFLFASRIIDPEIPLVEQGIVDGSALQVKFTRIEVVPENREDIRERWCREQAHIAEIYHEAIRLDDLRFSVGDARYFNNATYQAIIAESVEESSDDPEPTILEEATEISVQPLSFPDSDSSDIPTEQNYQPFFSSIEEAGEYFAKGGWGKWPW